MSAGFLFLLAGLECEMGRHERAIRLPRAGESAREVTGAVDWALADARAMNRDAAIAYVHEDS
jgi:hypothetical protein